MVVIGGPMANLVPEVCRPHCDVLFEGEAEYTWPRFLREFADGRHADRYLESEKIHLPDSPLPYEQRALQIRETFPMMLEKPFAKVHTIPFYPASFAGELYRLLKEENNTTFGGVEFYEGIVMKKAGSRYPKQRLNPDFATPDWVKHRWKF